MTPAGRHAGQRHPEDAGPAGGAAVVLVLRDGSSWRLAAEDPRVPAFLVLAAALRTAG